MNRNESRLRLRRGPLLMLAATVVFTLMVVAVKVARTELGALDTMFWRVAVSLPIAAAMAARTGFAVANRRAMAARGLLGFAAMLCWFIAAAGLSVADLSLLSKLEPVLVALAAPLWFGPAERAGGRVWLSLALGFAGTAVVLAPELAIGNAAGLFALASTLFAAGAHLSIRALSRTDRAEAVVFWFQVTTIVPTLLLRWGLEGAPPPLPPAHLWPALLATGVTAAAGQWLVTVAYRYDSAPVVSAAGFASPLWAVLADLVFFGQPPPSGTLLGGLLIVVSGLLLIVGPSMAAPVTATEER
ncbi:MAG: DMT family transporter [Myxococcota bacterium]|nr:DMT family transporter [Myxococcota bacterium]